MTKSEFRQSKEYVEAMTKIKSYSKGFTFTIHYGDIPKARGNALRVILEDAIREGILESVSIGLTVSGEPVDETYKRL